MGGAPYMLTKQGGGHSVCISMFIYERVPMFVVCTCASGHTIGMKWEGLQWEMAPPLHSTEENQWKSKARV